VEDDSEGKRDTDDEKEDLVVREDIQDVAGSDGSAHDVTEEAHDAVEDAREDGRGDLDDVHALYGGIAKFVPDGKDAHLAGVGEAHDRGGAKDAACGVFDVGDERPVEAVVDDLFGTNDDDDEGKGADDEDRRQGRKFQFGDISYQ